MPGQSRVEVMRSWPRPFPVSLELVFDLGQLRPHPFRDRDASQPETSRIAHAAGIPGDVLGALLGLPAPAPATVAATTGRRAEKDDPMHPRSLPTCPTCWLPPTRPSTRMATRQPTRGWPPATT